MVTESTPRPKASRVVDALGSEERRGVGRQELSGDRGATVDSEEQRQAVGERKCAGGSEDRRARSVEPMQHVCPRCEVDEEPLHLDHGRGVVDERGADCAGGCEGADG